MLLRSDVDQRVRIAALDLEVEFAAGEEMRTEISDKFRREGLQAELDSAGFDLAELVGGSGRATSPSRCRSRRRTHDAGRRARRRLRRRGVRRRAEPARGRLRADPRGARARRGECTYWACMPSKTLLRAPELLAAARQAPGAAEAASGALDLERVFWWRDQVVDGYEDEGHGEWLADRDTDARPRRRDGEGAGRPRRRRAGTPVRQARHRHRLASCRCRRSTGSRTRPTGRRRTPRRRAWFPESLVVVGGGASGVELAQLYQRLGSKVTIVQRSRLLTKMAEEAASLLQERLEEDGVRVTVRRRRRPGRRLGPGGDGEPRRRRDDRVRAPARRRRPHAHGRRARPRADRRRGRQERHRRSTSTSRPPRTSGRSAT